MRVVAILAGLCLLMGCGPTLQTLPNPVAGQPPLRAGVELPPGPGPFPAVVLLHGCGGLARNVPGWTEELVAAGFAVAAVDQYGPRGVSQTCTGPSGGMTMPNRELDTVALVRVLAARPDIRRDRIFLVGFSQGGTLTGTLMGSSWSAMPLSVVGPPGQTPAPAGGVGVYPGCGGMPRRLETPLLLISGGADDWTPAWTCEAYAGTVQPEALRPRVVVIPGAHHAFDHPASGTIFLPQVRNPFSPNGLGATVGYSAAATRQAREETIAFLRSRL